MILIDFKVDEYQLAKSLKGDILDVNKVSFTSVMFIMPIRIQINGMDLFEFRGNVWDSAPIMSLASSGLSHVKKLKISKYEDYGIIEGPGDLIFTMLDDNCSVKIFFEGPSKSRETIVNYDELLEAFELFAVKVKKFLRERAPIVNEHPYWGPWMRDEIDDSY